DDEAYREQLFAKGSGRLLYEILDDLFDYCFPILDKIGHKLDTIEDDMFEGRAEDVVRDISNVKQEIISYRKIIKPERATLRPLTLITGIFGMNVHFPGFDSVAAFWVIVVAMVTTLTGMVAFFKMKRWL